MYSVVKLKKSQLFLICNLAFIIGIIAGFLVRVSAFYLYVVFLMLIVNLAIFYQKYLVKIILLSGCFLVLGLWRYNVGLFEVDENKISFYNDSLVEFVGVVAGEPDVRIDHAKLKVSARGGSASGGESSNKKLSGNVLVSAKLFPEYFYGDELQISCKLKTPEQFDDFAYDKYLARFDIYSLCYYPKIKLLSKNNGSKFYAEIYRFKNKLKLIINQSLPEPQSSLLSAIILGARRGIPKELSEKFSQVGISHIMAISGMHIGILAVLLLYLGVFVGLHRNKAFYFASFILFLYILLIGFPASAVRAGVMGFLALLAMRLGRLNKAINAIIFAAALMLLINPLLIYDIGFALSFLAVLGLVYVMPILEFKKTQKHEACPEQCRGNTKTMTRVVAKFFDHKIMKTITTLMLVTVAAQITTLPAILYYFGRLSLVAPIANILIVPLLPLIMILGLVLLLAGLIWSGLAVAVGWVAWLALSYLIWVVNFLSGFGFSSLDIGISWWMVLVGYVGIGWFVISDLKIKKSRL